MPSWEVITWGILTRVTRGSAVPSQTECFDSTGICIYKYVYNPYAPCMEYLPTKVGDFVRANVGKY